MCAGSTRTGWKPLCPTVARDDVGLPPRGMQGGELGPRAVEVFRGTPRLMRDLENLESSSKLVRRWSNTPCQSKDTPLSLLAEVPSSLPPLLLRAFPCSPSTIETMTHSLRNHPPQKKWEQIQAPQSPFFGPRQIR